MLRCSLLHSPIVSGSEHHVYGSKLGEPVSAGDVIKEGSARDPLWQGGFSLLRAPSPGTCLSPSLWTVRIEAATTIKPTWQACESHGFYFPAHITVMCMLYSSLLRAIELCLKNNVHALIKNILVLKNAVI